MQPAAEPVEATASVVSLEPHEPVEVFEVDERGGFDLIGPVVRVEEHRSVYSLGRDGDYVEGNEEFVSLYMFQGNGHLRGCRIGRKPARIERDRTGRLIKITGSSGSKTRKETTIDEFDLDGNLQKKTVRVGEGDKAMVLSETVYEYDVFGKEVKSVRKQKGILDMTTMVIRQYDSNDVLEMIETWNKGSISTRTSIQADGPIIRREQVEAADGSLMQYTDVIWDDHGNWTERKTFKHERDSHGRLVERPHEVVRRVIAYTDLASASGSGD